jgi:hypothetical protein
MTPKQRVLNAAMLFAKREANEFYSWSGTLPQRMRRAATFFGDRHKKALVRACADMVEARSSTAGTKR